jgi:acetyltransferase-like isoleucine patch superfamily enzyme
MAFRSLNQFLKIRDVILNTKRAYFNKIWGMDLHPTSVFSLSARFDTTYPRGVHVGEYSYVAFGAAILTHDMTRGVYLHTRIGKNCFIGARSTILAGVEIGDESIVATGAVVTKNVPPRCIVAGNPAQIIRENIEVGRYGRFANAEATKQRLIAEGAFD